jgi:tRNA U38,U39,U40 pseudouridine synthase TruA
MVRKVTNCLLEVGHGNLRADAFASMLHADAEPFQPTAPPSGLFLEAIVYEGETFARPLAPIVPVESPRRSR